MNSLRKGLTDYLELRRGLGFKLVIDERHLRGFIAFLECRKTPHITTRLALEFATLQWLVLLWSLCARLAAQSF